MAKTPNEFGQIRKIFESWNYLQLDSTQFQAKVIPPIVEDTKNLEIFGSEANQESFSTLKIYSTTR